MVVDGVPSFFLRSPLRAMLKQAASAAASSSSGLEPGASSKREPRCRRHPVQSVPGSSPSRSSVPRARWRSQFVSAPASPSYECVRENSGLRSPIPNSQAPYLDRDGRCRRPALDSATGNRRGPRGVSGRRARARGGRQDGADPVAHGRREPWRLCHKNAVCWRFLGSRGTRRRRSSGNTVWRRFPADLTDRRRGSDCLTPRTSSSWRDRSSAPGYAGADVVDEYARAGRRRAGRIPVAHRGFLDRLRLCLSSRKWRWFAQIDPLGTARRIRRLVCRA